MFTFEIISFKLVSYKVSLPSVKVICDYRALLIFNLNLYGSNNAPANWLVSFFVFFFANKICFSL